MSILIKIPRRSRHLVHVDIIKALGGADEVAGMLRVQEITVRKAMQDPENGSGQDITVKNLQKLLTIAGQQLTNLPLQNAIDELLGDHFLNLCHRCAYLEERIFDVIGLLQNGKVQKAVNE